MAVKIKLKRMGKIRAPYYRIIVADARTKRDGRAIEEIGRYNPKTDPSSIEVDSDRAQHWLSVGAQPTDPVRRILEITGDWQKFKGLPGTEGTLRAPGARSGKDEAYAAAMAESVKTAEARADKGKARKAAAGEPGENRPKGARGPSGRARTGEKPQGREGQADTAAGAGAEGAGSASGGESAGPAGTEPAEQDSGA